MKEFMKTVRQTFQVGRGDMLSYSRISLGAGIVGIIIVMIVMAVTGKGEDYVTGGAVLAIIIGNLLIVFGGVFSLQPEYNLAISLGKTRKYYVPAKYFWLVTHCLLCMVIARIIGYIEELIYPVLYPNAGCEFSVSALFKSPAAIVGVVLLIPVAVMLFGALYMKFGMKFFWVFWVLWMFACTGLPRMITARKDDPDSLFGKMGAAFVDFFIQITNAQIIIGLVVLGIAGMAAAFLLLRKQSVTA